MKTCLLAGCAILAASFSPVAEAVNRKHGVHKAVIVDDFETAHPSMVVAKQVDVLPSMMELHSHKKTHHSAHKEAPKRRKLDEMVFVDPEDVSNAVQYTKGVEKRKTKWIGRAHSVLDKLKETINMEQARLNQNQHRLKTVSTYSQYPQEMERREHARDVLKSLNYQIRLVRSELSAALPKEGSVMSKDLMDLQNELKSVYDRTYSEVQSADYEDAFYPDVRKKVRDHGKGVKDLAHSTVSGKPRPAPVYSAAEAEKFDRHTSTQFDSMDQAREEQAHAVIQEAIIHAAAAEYQALHAGEGTEDFKTELEYAAQGVTESAQSAQASAEYQAQAADQTADSIAAETAPQAEPEQAQEPAQEEPEAEHQEAQEGEAPVEEEPVSEEEQPVEEEQQEEQPLEENEKIF